MILFTTTIPLHLSYTLKRPLGEGMAGGQFGRQYFMLCVLDWLFSASGVSFLEFCSSVCGPLPSPGKVFPCGLQCTHQFNYSLKNHINRLKNMTKLFSNLNICLIQGENCCSKSAISFHHISPSMMYVMEYLLYILRPSGFDLSQRNQSDGNTQ